MNTEPPIVLDKKRAITVPIALLLSALTVAAAVGIDRANIKAQLDQIPAMALRVNEQDKALAKIAVMANDIAWIKRELEGKRRDDRATARSP